MLFRQGAGKPESRHSGACNRVMANNGKLVENMSTKKGVVHTNKTSANNQREADVMPGEAGIS